MIVFHSAADTSNYIAQKKAGGATIGFVPTMGALHAGHISLINNSKTATTVTVCSIFVNPTQFNDPKDFEKYPVTITADIDALEKAGCDVLFLPRVQEIYPNGLQGLPHYELGYLETVLEGQHRPGHFQGVCQVVHRLMDIVQPNTLFLGQKDFQQCMVIKKLLEITGLHSQLQICATLREADGLAMSSRNMRLDAASREKAVRISEVLTFIKNEIKPGYLNDLKERAVNYLNAEGFKTDYIEIAAAYDLAIQEFWDGKLPLVALAAATINEVRLIDNMLLY